MTAPLASLWTRWSQKELSGQVEGDKALAGRVTRGVPEQGWGVGEGGEGAKQAAV